MGVIPLKQMTRRKYSQLRVEDFDKIKALIGYGLTIRQIGKITLRSTGTLSAVRNSSTFEEYKQKIRDKNAYLRVKKQECQVEPQAEERPSTEIMDYKNSLITMARTIEYNQMEQIKLQERTNKLLGYIIENTAKKGLFS